MVGITPAQLRKIHVLSRERDLDDDTLHAHVYALTGKSSLKSLTIKEGAVVINSLCGDKPATSQMMTAKQKAFIFGLIKDLGWTTAEGKPDESRLTLFIRERFSIEHVKWLTSKKASQVIEALKAIKARMEKEAEAI